PPFHAVDGSRAAQEKTLRLDRCCEPYAFCIAYLSQGRFPFRDPRDTSPCHPEREESESPPARGSRAPPAHPQIRGSAMAKIIETATGALALTFDDVLLQPAHSEVMPGQTNVAAIIARDIELNIPILSAAMDTVTDARLAIARAEAGGIGVIHRNFTPEEQAEQVRQVKKFESGMVVNPLTIGPDATLGDAQTLMQIGRASCRERE